MNRRTATILMGLISFAILSIWYVTSVVPVIHEDTALVRAMFGFVFPVMSLFVAAWLVIFTRYQNPHHLCEGTVIRKKVLRHRLINVVRDLLNQERQEKTYALKIRDDRGRTGWLHFVGWTVLHDYRIGSYYMTPDRLAAAQDEQRRRQFGA